ncbi:MAG: sodium-dependent transporter [Oscillospiraceae bacterium]|nr:sodium-dependent transporter [Oscillospiraceae bacterium]
MKREKFGSRLGFILVSAGCAIGIGNVWKFPYMCGQYGGAAFILIYLFFLLIMGIPILVCEFAIGRGSQRSVAMALDTLEKPRALYHRTKWMSVAGNYLLMMFYTTVAGWMLCYCFKSIKGDFNGATPEQVAGAFDHMLGNAPQMLFWMALVCVLGFGVCAFGLKGGLERVSKVMMTALLLIMVVLAVHSVFLNGAGEGIQFYLVPNFSRMVEAGIGNVIFGAMSQAFFTLSIGIGSMMVFGSYIDKKRSLTGEAITIASLDTFVALMAGFIIIPACFAFGVEPGAGPSLIFITIPNIFAKMAGGQIWAALFFLFLSFAAFSTVTAVFENIISFTMDLGGWSRIKSVLINGIAILLLSIPCVLGFNVLSGVQLLGEGSTIMDLEDFIVSNNLLPLGSLVFVLFCTRKSGWGWNGFLTEVNAGKGMRFPAILRLYVTYVIPALIIFIYLTGYYDMFSPMGWPYLLGWMAVALALLAFILCCAIVKRREKPSQTAARS